ncbi:glycosyltransferase [Sciscionella marina]|uniref:glycosyltransferase n=1 Tax=Sciscionella marina TaxID=508770 RepID=UPI0003A7D8FE|nr:nucleotide disphospho-sugar-binding domain-containing protein [Sciscionella marina]
MALLTGGGIQSDITPELPTDVEFLAAGAMPAEFSGDAARRTGLDMFQPTPGLIGEIFGGSRLDLGAADAIEVARMWGPDLVVAEAFDSIGPMVAAALGLAWHQVGIGPGVPVAVTDEIDRLAAHRYLQVGLVPVAASSYLDPCPSLLQDPDWTSRYPVHPLRAQAHRRSGDVEFDLAPFTDRSNPTVLVTLGTIFSDPDTLAAAVAAVAGPHVNVIATIGSSMRAGSASAPTAGTTEINGGEVRYVPFIPLAFLLDRADLLVGCGGAGTVLGSIVNGVPMVLWPLGAEQPINAARAAAAGVSITVESAQELPVAVKQALADERYRRLAHTAAAENARRPSATDAIRHIASRGIV